MPCRIASGKSPKRPRRTELGVDLRFSLISILYHCFVKVKWPRVHGFQGLALFILHMKM